MNVILSPRASKQLKKLSKIDQIAAGKKIRTLRDNDSITNAEKLRGYSDIFRIRFGDYRIVFRVIPSEIYIIAVSHRRDIYKLISRLL